MDETREQLLNAHVAIDVASYVNYIPVKLENPILARMMLDRTVKFFLDTEVTDFERCLVFSSFLNKNNNEDDREYIISKLKLSNQWSIFQPLVYESALNSGVRQQCDLKDSLVKYFESVAEG